MTAHPCNPWNPWIAFLVLALTGACSRTPLPELPALSMEKFLPAIRQDVQTALDAAKARPNEAQANGRLGMVLHAYQQYAAAEVCYERAHRLDPREFRWLYYQATVLASQGKYETAGQTFERALALRDYLPARLQRAEALLSAGKLEESGRLFDSLTAQNPELAQAHYGLGRVLSSMRQTREAIAAFRKACELFPAYGASHYALALALQ